ncbi:MAG: glycosyltransferase family protein [Verrucomicrobiota bacterium]|jgi:uncharacterized protein (TIGR00661 family)
MKICFTIQGEGRGHFTQALAMREMLGRRGHEVVAAIAGTNGKRPLPDYVHNAFGVPLQTMFSPGFQFKAGRGISVAGSVGEAFGRLPEFRQSLRLLDETITKTKPDLIINFLEAATGVGKFLRRIKVPVLVLGHQFMLGHPAFVRSSHARTQQLGFRNFVNLVGSRSAKLALSFYPAEDQPRRKLFVCPPILRRQLFELKNVHRGDYVLVYLLNHGYAGDIEHWCAENPTVPVHCFYDKPGAPEEEKKSAGLTFHKLHGEKFLQFMASCRAVVCTAGFESVSEAAYLGKPVLMIPVQNHIEQFLNALDAVQAGIGLNDLQFNLSRLLTPNVPCAGQNFRDWVDRAESIAMNVAEKIASDPD